MKKSSWGDLFHIKGFPEDFMFVLKKGRIQFFKDANCDLKEREREAFKIFALCIYRIRSGYAFKRIK